MLLALAHRHHTFGNLSTEGTDAPDMVMVLFNSAGNAIALDVDSGSGPTSQLSFGQVDPPRPAPGDGFPFAGQNGSLPAGDYYVAISYNSGGIGLSQSPTTNGRWHIRSYTNNAGYTAHLTVLTSWATCSCHGNCTADFDDGSGNNIPDGGVTIDDLLYYLTIFADGVTCADIDDGSGSGTTDGGVTIDDLLYFLTRFAAGC